jgi:hypothetical protein
VGPVERQLTGVDVATDQQVVVARQAGIGGGDQRPVVEPLAFRAGSGGDPVEGGLGQGDGDVDGPAGAGLCGDLVVGGDSERVAQAAMGQFGA